MDEKKSEKEIEEILKKIIMNDDFDQEVSKNPLHVQTVCSAIEQYLSPFTLFGYDVNGDAVVLSNAQTQKDIDGLMISIGRYMAQQRMGEMNDDIGDFME